MKASRRSIFAIILVLLVFAAELYAAPRTCQHVQDVVKGWLKAEAKPLNMVLGQNISRIETYTDDQNQALYHIVYLDPSGFVIVPADDLVEPIIGFSAAGVYDPSPDNPFGALVTKDLPQRMAVARGQLPLQGTQESRASIHESARQKARDRAQAKWGAFTDVAKEKGVSTAPGILKKIRDAVKPDALGGDEEPIGSLASLSDVRVAPLIQSRWNQSQECGGNCYNYYTPNNYLSGCVATAMAQLMRYHQYPTVGIGVHAFEVTVDDNAQNANTRGGDGQGGPYDWAAMALDPECGITETQRQAIGALCADAGATAHMSYTADFSGAYMDSARDGLKDIFLFDNVIHGGKYRSATNIGSGIYGMLNPNLDAGLPCLLAIYGLIGGHAIVADGYGYDGSTLYHHLNMGWAGFYDAWYNLPAIDVDGSGFDTVSVCLYNIFVAGTGEIISGRVVDRYGSPLSDVIVTATGPGGPYSDTTDLNGIYALTNVQSSATYTLTANGASDSLEVTTGSSTDYAAASGNIWAADLTADDGDPPLPNPMEWKVEPNAVGLQTIYMEADVATDASGVEYFFDCVNVADANLDSGWQSGTVYYRNGYAEGTTYQFRVKARDKSENQNETQWSETISTTTASGTDTLSPMPNPAQWKAVPRKLTSTRIAMEGAAGYDEIGTSVQYFFECVSTTDPAFPDPNVLSSDWQTSSIYQRSGLHTGSPGNEYVYRVRVRDAAGNMTEWSENASVVLAPPPVVREVPYAYSTIQAAIDACKPASGDTILVSPNVYAGNGNINLNFDIPVATLAAAGLPASALKVTIRGDIENPSGTIIDCGGTLWNGTSNVSPLSPCRAFILRHGEGSGVVIEGFLIRDGLAVDRPYDVDTTTPGGMAGDHAFGGAILGGDILNVPSAAVSPIIRHCIFSNCNAIGQAGAWGWSGLTAFLAGGIPNGGNGMNGGNGFGGAMYFVAGSKPTIENVQFLGCSAIGGDGGKGGDGAGMGDDSNITAPGSGGNGGNAGIAAGGAIYFEPGCQPQLLEVEISSCQAVIGQIGSGGDGGDGNQTVAGGNGGNTGDLMGTFTHGGAFFFDTNSTVVMNNSSISACTLSVLQTGYAPGTGGGGTPAGTNGSNIATAGNLGLLVSCGGANFYGANSTATLTNTTIENNTSTLNQGGGEFYDTQCTTKHQNCQILGNTSPSVTPPYGAGGTGGGGVYLNDPASSIFTDCVVSDNSAYGGAGIHYNGQTNGAVSFTDCTFSNNNSNVNSMFSYGGAVYAGNITKANNLIDGVDSLPSSFTLTVTGCTFDTNISPYGGGICADGVNLTITGSTFTGNSSQYGGGVFVYGSNAMMQGCTFKENEAAATLPNAEAASGAAAYLQQSDFTIVNSAFLSNSSQDRAGAVTVLGSPLPSQGNQAILNSLFIGNSSLFSGGALRAEYYTELVITNCTFADNTVVSNQGQGGALLCYDAFVDVLSSIFWNNAARFGSQIALGDSFEQNPVYIPLSTVFLDYSDVKDGLDAIYLADEGQLVWYGSQNIESDPFFAVTHNVFSSDNYYLSHEDAGQLADSPCIDTGFGDVSDLNAKIGFDGTTRTDHIADVNTVDMGYHYDAAAVSSKQYTLTLVVDRGGELTQLKAIVGGLDPNEFFSPDSNDVPAGSVVRLEALLGESYTVKAWHGTNNDTSTGLTNSVTMNANKTVTLECDTTIPSLRVFITNTDGHTGTIKIDSVVTPEGATTLRTKGAVVALQAIPANASDSVWWLGTDDDTLLTTTNTVTMTESIDVYVTFYTPTIYNVTGDFTELQYAIDTAKKGDIIILHPGVYEPVQSRATVIDKNIRIQSYNPDDPTVVANTIIIGKSWVTGGMSEISGLEPPTPGGHFIFSGTNRTAVLNGLTIQDTHWRGVDGCPGSTPCNPLPDGMNGASISGGAISFIDDASATIKNCKIVNCSTTGGNGGVGAPDGDGGWGGRALGGAVAIGSGDPRFINCQFVGNYARGGGGGDGGGGVPLGDRGGSWEDPLDPWGDWDYGPYLYYWKYSGYGGAIYCDTGSKPEFVNCLFSNNAVYGGHTGYGDTNYPYKYYKIDRYGGAVYAAEGSTLTFTQCIFENNLADTVGPEETYTFSSPVATSEEDPYYAYGGTIAFEDDVVVTLKDCVIEGSQAHHGGGIYAEYATLNIADSNFAENIASFGGALYYVVSDVTIDRSAFMNNDANIPASQGGAIFAFDSNSIFTDIVFNGNSSGLSGGAMFTAAGETTVKNALVINNEAVRDGAGFSSNWYSDVDIQNGTFGYNQVLGTSSGVSKGGAIYAGYQTYMDVNDSILWGNSASQGQQISIGTGFEFDPVPSTLTISYSDVQGGRGFTAVSVEEGCTLNWNDADMLYADPLLVSPQTDLYYLQQPSAETPGSPTSPCVDTGSGPASAIGLDKYTTAYPVPRFDFGIVDMGYHYPFELKTNNCAYADLAYAAMGYQLDGVVSLSDLVILASHWLQDDCGQANRWCHGADLNFYSGVDFDDFVFLSSCWGIEDIQLPSPNPSQWKTAPMPVDETTDTIYMEAVQATDNWIGGVEYFFENQTDPNHNSGWRQGFDSERDDYWYDPNEPTKRPWIFVDEGLQSDKAYTYVVKVRDVAGNETAASQPASAIPGVDVFPPSPNPSQWAVEPYQTGSTSLRMQAVQATDAEGNGVEYMFVCVENSVFSSGWRQNVASGDAGYMATPWVYDVNGLTVGQSYTFYVKTRDRSLSQNETDPSTSVAVTMAELDATPPIPNPAVIVSVSAPYKYGDIWYQIITATEAEDEDDSGVEYKFTSTDGAPISGNNALWRYDVNATAPTPRPAGTVDCSTLVDPTGTTQLARTIWVNVGSQFASYTYRVQYRDQSPAANTGEISAAVHAP